MGVKSALITGITGQDGSYLAELLLAKGYKVYGAVRRLSTPNIARIEHILDDITLIPADMLDQSSLIHALQIAQPHEIYNLAAMSHVGTSFTEPLATAEVTGMGATRLLEAIRITGIDARFYQASTSELYGGIARNTMMFINNSPRMQSERTPFYPRSPYGVAKLQAHWSTINYREAYGMYACSGILFNHESPRRGYDFVTRKITRAVARIRLGLQDKLTLGNIDACRDWGYAGDYVKAMWAMLQQDTPKDYVIATGDVHSVREFVQEAFSIVGLNHHDHLEIDESLYRPSEVPYLCGDSYKAQTELGWYPSVSFHDLVAMMVDHDLRCERAQSGRKQPETKIA